MSRKILRKVIKFIVNMRSSGRQVILWPPAGMVRHKASIICPRQNNIDSGLNNSYLID